MHSPSLYDVAYNAISSFYWEQYSGWMAMALAAVMWAPLLVAYWYGFGRGRPSTELAAERSSYTIVAVPPKDKLAFPESCVGCGEATARNAFVTVSAGIGASTMQEFSATPGAVIGHSVKWRFPSCADCASQIPASGPMPMGWSGIFFMAILIVALLVVAVGFTVVISAMDFVQLVWLLPAAAIFVAIIGLCAEWSIEQISRLVAGLSDKEMAPPSLFRNPLPSVFFRIDKVERLPGYMSDAALPWGPHVYRFVFEHRDYAERFSELNRGISAPFDRDGRREVDEQIRSDRAGSSAL